MAWHRDVLRQSSKIGYLRILARRASVPQHERDTERPDPGSGIAEIVTDCSSSMKRKARRAHEQISINDGSTSKQTRPWGAVYLCPPTKQCEVPTWDPNGIARWSLSAEHLPNAAIACESVARASLAESTEVKRFCGSRKSYLALSVR